MSEYIEPEPLTIWHHEKTNSYYTVLGVSRCSTNGNEAERAVIYLSHERRILHHRLVGEFMDGRFTLDKRSTPIHAAKLLVGLRDRMTYE